MWTFTLITLYFGLGAVLSMHGCYKYHNKVGGDGMCNFDGDAEQGTQGSSLPAAYPNMASSARNFRKAEVGNDRQIAGFWGYVFQVTFQMSAGAVMLTDTIFWFIIVPLLAIKDYELSFLLINMHAINTVFLVGGVALNCMRFRIVYFFLWTTVYVIFQWILHSLSSTWWPYPFLDLSDSFSPLCLQVSTVWRDYLRRAGEVHETRKQFGVQLASYDLGTNLANNSKKEFDQLHRECTEKT